MRRLTLTFDNGPTPGITESVLDELGKADVGATFFLVGTQLEKPGGRAIAERARAAGHRLGNHTYSHGIPLGLQDRTGASEIRRMHDLMGDLVGDKPLFRPNGRGTIGTHLLSDDAVATLKELRSTVVLWTSVPRDRAAVIDRPDTWVEDAKQAVRDCDWTLLVLHDRPSGFSKLAPMAFLSEFLDWATKECEIVMDYPAHCLPIVAGVPQASLGKVLTPMRATS